MNWRENFKSVAELFNKPERKSGKIIDCVDFQCKDKLPSSQNNSNVVLFSLINPSLSLFQDNIHYNIRKRFYDLFSSLPEGSVIFDLGYHVYGENTKQTIIKLFKDLSNSHTSIIVLSSVTGMNTLLYNSLKKLNKAISIAEASPFLPISDLTDNNGIKEILSDPENNLFNYSNIGMQSFLNSTASQDLFRKMLFDSYRMGLIKNDISIAEPVIRDSQLFILDSDSIAVSDAPSANLSNPNGLSGFEACRLSRFAGVSEKNKSFCISNIPYSDDPHSTTSFLIAQMLWYFSEGWFNRKTETPGIRNRNFKTYITETGDYGTFTFLQSIISDRWWLQIETQKGKKITISCLMDDYIETLKGEIPEKFIKFQQKIS